ncbi:MAG: hypothetical protein AAF726_14085 [Planctomycetota bacterium]
MNPLAPLLLAIAAPLQEDTSRPLTVPEAGFSFDVPADGWSADRRDGNSFVAQPDGSGGRVGITIYWLPLEDGIDAEAASERTILSTRSRSEAGAVERLVSTEIDGRPAAGFDLEWETEAVGQVRIRQRHVVGDDLRYVVQSHAPIDSWGQYEGGLERIVASFRMTEVVASDEERIGALAQRCGSEIDWEPDWQAAAARAVADERPILVVLRSYPGFDLPDTTRYGTFMDEEVIALVGARVVPVRLSAHQPSPLRDPAVYGLSPTTFGVALILCEADGTVVADTPRTEPEAVHLWLRTALTSTRTQDVARPEDPVAAARFALDRGELERAEASLSKVRRKTATGELLRARLALVRRDGAAAMEALASAEQIDPATAGEVACMRAEVLLRDRRFDEARDALAASAQSESVDPRALFLASQAEAGSAGIDAARPLRERLAREFPESRWGWLAAAYLELEPILRASEDRKPLGWPREEVLDLVLEPVRAPLPARSAKRAEAEAVAWLLAHQRSDGSWPSPTEFSRPDETPPELIATAINALATRALLQRGARYERAASRGLAFLIRMDALRRADPPPVLYMDYTAWAAWAQLELVADALEAGVDDEEALRRWGAHLVQDLETRVRANGGWSYYVSGDAAGEQRVEQSISFTTAAVAVGLCRASAVGIEVPEGLVDGALDCLEEMRGDDGLFAYMLRYPGGAQTRSAAPGAAGRGPACELALFRGGRVPAERLEGALALFDQNAWALAGEVGKALMHAGADSQGCHYPFFDYLMAARAARATGGRVLSEHRAKILELVLDARLADGSFQDTPILGRPFGTAAALLTLAALKD